MDSFSSLDAGGNLHEYVDPWKDGRKAGFVASGLPDPGNPAGS